MKLRKRGYVGTTSTVMSQREKDNAILAREAAAEGFVLLKNEAQTLPLKPGTKIGLYGAGAVRTIKGGTGSGDVNNRYNVNIYDGLKNAGYEITSAEWLEGYDSCYIQAQESWKSEIFRKLTEECNGNFFEAYSTTPFSMPAGAAIDAESAKTDGPVTILETLGITKNYDYSNEKEEANKSGFIKTTVNFSTFKNAMLKYMTEECYQKQWEDYFENEDGYLCYYNVGASGIAYKVNTIKSTENGYIANVTASSEGPDWDITVNFAIDDTKCIISYYKLQ